VRCEYHDKHSYTKMTSRRGSRMISKAERRPERHGRDYMGRVHVYTLLSALSRIFPSLSMSSLISTRIHSRPLPPAISSFPLHDEHVARRLHPHLDRFYLLLPFRKAIFNRRHSRIAVQAVALKAVIRKRECSVLNNKKHYCSQIRMVSSAEKRSFTEA